MTKLLKSLSVMFAVATAGTLAAGCDLYFGDHGDHNDQWNYCGSDGYYSCTGDNCDWEGSTCPVGGGSATTGDGCTTNTDCAAGCFCGSGGTCTESGFCGSDSDCGSGYTCDVSRSTCEPGTPTPTCGSNSDCATGTVCDAATGACDATCTCTDDTDATDAGYGYCDTTRDTCMTGENPAGTCTGTVTCNTKAPTCADGQVPLILDGCYTGSCGAITACDSAPACAEIQHEDDCLARTADCGAVYTGEDCTTKSGTACTSGDTGCTCKSFEFNSCAAKAN